MTTDTPPSDAAPPELVEGREGDAERALLDQAREIVRDCFGRGMIRDTPDGGECWIFSNTSFSIDHFAVPFAAALRSALEERDMLEQAHAQNNKALDLALRERDTAREAALAYMNILRNPTSDMLNRAADDMIRDIDPLQQKARIMLDAVADYIERALASVTSHPLDEDRQRAAGRNPDRQSNQGYTTRPGSDADDS